MKKSEGPPQEKESAGVPYSSPETQRPFLKAFRKFILTRKNENGLPWTPTVILEKLWELWPERPIVKEAKLQFQSEHIRKFERMRSNEPQEYLKDATLFMLIQRFLEDQNIAVVERAFLKSLQLISSNASTAFFPTAGLPKNSPVNGAPPDRTRIEVYTLSKSRNLIGLKNRILVLRVTPKVASIYLGLVVDVPEMDVKLGLYLNVSREFYARDSRREIYVRYSLVEGNKRLFVTRRKRGVASNEKASEPEFSQNREFTFSECLAHRARDPEIIEIANRFATNFFSFDYSK